MSHENASVKSILFALLANLGIAITKTAAAVVTGSGSMLAESIHSYADCGNQGLLFWGLRSAAKAPDSEHPLGHGKAVYFWSFIVALMLFSMGGLFSVYEGIHKLGTREGLNNPLVAVFVLFVSLLMEGASLLGCLKQVKTLRGNQSVWQWLRTTRRSELVVVLGEDTAALLGLFFAMIFVLLAMITGNPVFDAIGSIVIGSLLIAISIVIAGKVKSLLIGQSADQETEDSIRVFLENRPEIKQILNMITLQLGPEVMLTVKVRMRDVPTAVELITDINTCESELKKALPAVRWVFFEPDLRD